VIVSSDRGELYQPWTRRGGTDQLVEACDVRDASTRTAVQILGGILLKAGSLATIRCSKDNCGWS
jgi:hypothetical protein